MYRKKREIRKHHGERILLIWSLRLILIAIFAVGVRAQSYPCANAIYFTSNSNTNVYRYTPSTNSITRLSGTSIGAATAASALTPDGERIYSVDGATPFRLRYNSGGTTNATAATTTATSTPQRNAIAPDGTGYFMVGTAASWAYYRYTTGGATSTVTSGTLTVQPTTAPALGNGGDITFDSNGVAYLLDQAKNFYRLDFTNNVANYIGAVTGMGTESPNGIGFSLTNSGVYELYVSTLNNTIYRINLATMAAALVNPSSTVAGFTQNDIASCIYPPNITPNITATKAWRNVTKGDPNNFTTSTAASVGNTLEYRVVVRNSGAIAAGDVTFQDTIPSGVTYVSGTTTLNSAAVTDNAGTGNARFSYAAAKTIQGAGQTANSGALKVDSTPATLTDNEAVVTFRVTVNNPFNGSANPIANTAQINYAGATSAVNSNVVNTPVLLPDLTIAKTHAGDFTRGLSGTYTITITNGGTAPTSALITVTDNLPTDLRVNNGAAGAVAAGGTNGANWSCASNALSPQTITCTSNTAISNAAGSNTSVFSLTINVTLTAAASLTNNVSVFGGGEAALNTGDNTASDPTTTIALVPNVGLLKSCPLPADCTTAPQLSGADLTYRIQFTNTGGHVASAMTIFDANPLNTDFKVGTAQASVGTSGLIFAIEYSNNYSSANPALATWTYVPVSAGGGAAAGYDRNVKAVRWRVTAGTLSNIAPNNTGSVSFMVKIR